MGVGIARCFAQAGATVYINDLFPKRAERVAENLREDGLDAHAKAFDVTDFEGFND
jgi:NAD(P)-dependent dehydrogenase (short-subunit alcohol dehydrogenase family)